MGCYPPAARPSESRFPISALSFISTVLMDHLTVMNYAGDGGVLAEKDGRSSGSRQELGRRKRRGRPWRYHYYEELSGYCNAVYPRSYFDHRLLNSQIGWPFDGRYISVEERPSRHRSHPAGLEDQYCRNSKDERYPEVQAMFKNIVELMGDQQPDTGSSSVGPAYLQRFVPWCTEAEPI